MKYEYEGLNWGAKNTPAESKHGTLLSAVGLLLFSSYWGKVYRSCSLSFITVVDLERRLPELGAFGRQRAFVDAMQRGMVGGRGDGVVWHSQLNNWVSLRWWRSSAHRRVCAVYCSALSATLLPSLTRSPFSFSSPLSAVLPTQDMAVTPGNVGVKTLFVTITWMQLNILASARLHLWSHALSGVASPFPGRREAEYPEGSHVGTDLQPSYCEATV